MLKQVIFCLRMGGELEQPVRGAARYLQQCGLKTKICHTADGDEISCDDAMETLFLADDMEIIEKLRKSGFYAIGIQKSEDTQQRFSGVKYVFTDIEEVEADSYEKAFQRLAGLPWKILETDRCIVRETTVNDVNDFYRIYADPSMTKYMEGLFEHPEDEIRYTKDYIEKVYGLLGFGVWTVIEKKNGTVIGRAGFSIRNGFDDVELGFLIGVPWQKKGYATEVCSAVMNYGKEVLQFREVQTLVKKENEVSIHICEKLGFRRYDEVDIEENIYGESYQNGRSVNFSPSHYGKYVRLIWESDRQN
ncbi:MAG: GNAT family N-acetyltransferase [Butyrivibrio sp.]|nr:GNAT family N-acetyltransferase [Butyrivibrio sp.]